MGKHAQLVMGPAGSGKSTYCDAIRKHCEATGRSVHVINLDPAAESFSYPVSVDIRDIITVDDVMEELGFGPNGGLVYCMEHLLENLDVLEEEIGDFEDDYLIIDCPGQIEVFIHYPIMKRIAEALQQWGYGVCGLYLLDSHFVAEPSKFISGVMMCLSVMYQLEIPHINVITKMDLWNTHKAHPKDKIDKYLMPDVPMLLHELKQESGPKLKKLTKAIASLIENDPLVAYIPLNIQDEDSISALLTQVDNAMQYGEDLEPKEPKWADAEDEEEDAEK